MDQPESTDFPSLLYPWIIADDSQLVSELLQTKVSTFGAGRATSVKIFVDFDPVNIMQVPPGEKLVPDAPRVPLVNYSDVKSWLRINDEFGAALLLVGQPVLVNSCGKWWGRLTSLSTHPLLEDYLIQQLLETKHQAMNPDHQPDLLN